MLDSGCGVDMVLKLWRMRIDLWMLRICVVDFVVAWCWASGFVVLVGYGCFNYAF